MRSPEPAFNLRAALTKELRAALEELDDVADDAKAVHRCRVRLKRARALSRVGYVGAPGLSDVFNDSARAVMHALARARDVAALSETARKLARKSKPKTAAALSALAEALEVRAPQMDELNIETIRAGVKDLLALAQVWPEASPRQIRRGAHRIIRRARRARRRGWMSEQAANRHEWRRREKDRFYAASLLGDDWPRRRKLKLGARLGDILGKERDTLLLLQFLEHSPHLAGPPKAAARAYSAVAGRTRRLAARADAVGALLHADGA